MKPEDIKVGKTYCNKGKGRTRRTVLAIGPEHLPRQAFNTDGKFPDGAVGVQYQQVEFGIEARLSKLWLRSFASWAGSIVE